MDLVSEPVMGYEKNVRNQLAYVAPTHAQINRVP
jgi:hypothetical protein